MHLFVIVHSIEGIPLITRFKTTSKRIVVVCEDSIEGIPLITRFKTKIFKNASSIAYDVLKAFHL